MEGGSDVTLDDVRHRVSSASRLRAVGGGAHSAFLPEWRGDIVEVGRLSGMIAVEQDDLVFEAWAGTPVLEVQEELREYGLQLPLSDDPELPPVVRGGVGTLGGLIAMGLPHALVARSGGPKDWVLGMTIVRGDGSLAKCGSRVVKNVAGYDVHKAMVGSRGTLGVIAKVWMRADPFGRAAPHSVRLHDSGRTIKYIGRTMRTDFDRTVGETQGVVATDPESCTLWAESPVALCSEGWCIGKQGYRSWKPPFEESALASFDPECKFAPGWD